MVICFHFGGKNKRTLLSSNLIHKKGKTGDHLMMTGGSKEISIIYRQGAHASRLGRDGTRSGPQVAMNH